MWTKHIRPKHQKPLFSVFIYTKHERIKEYPVLEVGELEYLCISPYNDVPFTVLISKTFKTRDELKFHNFKTKMDEKKRPERIRALSTTKQTEYKKRYLEEYPEKAI